MDAESVDAIVTDPPAGIAFMGSEWDRDRGGRDAWVAWLTEVMAEAFRVAKPGAHAVVWALPRTSGWTHRALEDAGWEVRDCLTHLTGQGFPKSHNLPGGLGSALKPSAEFWYLARKPLAKGLTIAANVAEWGTGALNIDGCRIEASPEYGRSAARADGTTNKGDYFSGKNGGLKSGKLPDYASTQGRWPANVILSEDAAAALDAAVGETKPGRRGVGKGSGTVNTYGGVLNSPRSEPMYSDSGGPSRYFLTVAPDLPIDDPDFVPWKYQAKASRAERNAGLEGMPDRSNAERDGRQHYKNGVDLGGSGNPINGTGKSTPAANHHPTVKPVSLCRWLVRLVTPPGGLVLDPFAGSGTTGVACAHEGFRFVGIERDLECIEISRARIAHAGQQCRQEPMFAMVAD